MSRRRRGTPGPLPRSPQTHQPPVLGHPRAHAGFGCRTPEGRAGVGGRAHRLKLGNQRGEKEQMRSWSRAWTDDTAATTTLEPH